MKRVKAAFLVVSSILLTVFLSACGDGATSSSGGGSREATAFAGQYFGSESLALSGQGLRLPLGTFPLRVAITASGGVVVTDVEGIQFVGELGNATNGRPPNQLVAFGVIALPPRNGVSCRPARVRYVGVVSGNMITGNSAAPLSCFASGRSFSVLLSGPFTATRAPVGQAPRFRGQGGKQGAILESLQP